MAEDSRDPGHAILPGRGVGGGREVARVEVIGERAESVLSAVAFGVEGVPVIR